ncbi:MAG: prephenate dehydrogenase/arogenate dehydrogenase family protein [Anaerolineae bacterium]
MNLTVVGLGLVGTSVGLALKGVSDDISIMGHDADADKVERAQELGAIDKSHWNLLSACGEADLILLDMDLEEMETTLEALSGEIGEGVVIVDTFALKRPVLELARRLLSDDVHFVGGHGDGGEVPIEVRPVKVQPGRSGRFHAERGDTRAPQVDDVLNFHHPVRRQYAGVVVGGLVDECAGLDVAR